MDDMVEELKPGQGGRARMKRYICIWMSKSSLQIYPGQIFISYMRNKEVEVKRGRYG